jgi:hypothetical protein
MTSPAHTAYDAPMAHGACAMPIHKYCLGRHAVWHMRWHMRCGAAVFNKDTFLQEVSRMGLYI